MISEKILLKFEIFTYSAIACFWINSIAVLIIAWSFDLLPLKNDLGLIFMVANTFAIFVSLLINIILRFINLILSKKQKTKIDNISYINFKPQ